jgi:hypothetical protein
MLVPARFIAGVHVPFAFYPLHRCLGKPSLSLARWSDLAKSFNLDEGSVGQDVRL